MNTPRAHRTELPRAVHATGKVANPDYASAFELSTPDAASLTPEQWLRAAFEGAPVLLRWFQRAGWRFGLGLRLAPTSAPECVLGWPVVDSGADSATIEAHSRILGSQNVVVVTDTKVVLVTFVRFNRPVARPVWAVVTLVHHRLLPFLLRRANRLARTR